MTFTDWLNAARVHFPALDETNCRLTSPADEDYNCISWAAEDPHRWWWPDAQQQKFWPPTAPRVETVDAFVKAFESIGYSASTDTSIETGQQKIAIFVNAAGTPTHAARQLLGGWWTSKLGQQIDIEHELSAIEGPAYGRVAIVLCK